MVYGIKTSTVKFCYLLPIITGGVPLLVETMLHLEARLLSDVTSCP
jgi:hypothetical protein